jgi:hypothetical protein
MDAKRIKWKKKYLDYHQMTFLHNIHENEHWMKFFHPDDIVQLERFLSQGWYNNKRDTEFLSTLRMLYIERIQVNRRYKVSKIWQDTNS